MGVGEVSGVAVGLGKVGVGEVVVGFAVGVGDGEIGEGSRQ